MLFVLPTLHGGGAERVVLTILRHLDRHLFEVSLAVVDARKPAFATDLPQGVEVIDLGCTRVRYSGAALIRLIWGRRPDIVFCALGHLNLQLALIKPLLPRSTKLMKDLSRPAASASCSWDIPLRSRYSRNTFPKAHFGPVVG